jgi:hypothetical protein
MDRYKYSPLTGPRETWLISLAWWVSYQPLQCHIRHVSLELGTYDALSYV